MTGHRTTARAWLLAAALIAVPLAVAAADAAGDGATLDGARSTRTWLADRLRLAPGVSASACRVKCAAKAPLPPVLRRMRHGRWPK